MKSLQFNENFHKPMVVPTPCPYIISRHMPLSCHGCRHCDNRSIDKQRGVLHCRADDVYKPLQVTKPQTGDALLVHTESTMGSIIQFFQQISSPNAGYYNHSGLVKDEQHATYVYEATQLEGHKLRAAVRPTPLKDYLDKVPERYQLMILRPKRDVAADPRYEETMLKYVGMPYDYVNLVWHQVRRILSGGIWKGRKKEKAWRRLICHEYTMTVYDAYAGWFPKCHQGAVEELYHSEHFDRYLYYQEAGRQPLWVHEDDAKRLIEEVRHSTAQKGGGDE